MLSSRLKPVYAVLFGLCVPLGLAPFNLWPLMMVGIAGFFWLSITAQSSKQALLFGWLFGTGFFGLGMSWIFGSMQTVDTPLWLSLFLTGGFCLLLAISHSFQLWFFFRFLKKLPLALLVIAPLWWVINEWVREWFLTGMPWLYAGYGFTETPVVQLASITGIYGLSLLMVLVSCWLLKSVLSYMTHKNIRSLSFAALAFLMLIFAAVLGWQKPASSWTSPIRNIIVAAVQSNVDQRIKWSTAQQQPTLEFYGDSISHMPKVDLILWPEAAMTQREDEIPCFISHIQAIGEQRDQAIFTGMVTYHDGRFYNALIGYGTATGEYQKQHLVPFGEYVPVEKILRRLIAFFGLPMATLHPAPVQQTPIPFSLADEPYFVAPVICYEAAYSEIVRKLAIDSDLITVVSNDAWFGDSIGPHQHFQITRVRAIENGRDLLRATQNGISALVNADGKVVHKSEQFVETELIGQLTLRTGHTPFQSLPTALIPWLCTLIISVFLFIHALKGRSSI